MPSSLGNVRGHSLHKVGWRSRRMSAHAPRAHDGPSADQKQCLVSLAVIIWLGHQRPSDKCRYRTILFFCGHQHQVPSSFNSKIYWRKQQRIPLQISHHNSVIDKIPTFIRHLRQYISLANIRKWLANLARLGNIRSQSSHLYPATVQMFWWSLNSCAVKFWQHK